MIQLNAASKQKLKGVHPDLVKVVEKCAAISDVQFLVTCGARSMADQRKAVMGGFSTTMHSRHIPGGHDKLAHAVDIAPIVAGKIPWNIGISKQKAWWLKLRSYMQQAAKAEGIEIEWGGDWKKFKDYPHFQLSWEKYPG